MLSCFWHIALPLVWHLVHAVLQGVSPFGRDLAVLTYTAAVEGIPAAQPGGQDAAGAEAAGAEAAGGDGKPGQAGGDGGAPGTDLGASSDVPQQPPSSPTKKHACLQVGHAPFAPRSGFSQATSWWPATALACVSRKERNGCDACERRGWCSPEAFLLQQPSVFCSVVFSQCTPPCTARTQLSVRIRLHS
jgi:hypothetical protein